MTQLHEFHEYFRISMETSSFYLKSCISKCSQSQQGNQWWQIPRPATCQWLAPLKYQMELLTTWHTFWCHDQLFDVRCVFTSWPTFCCHEVFFYFMTNFWRYNKVFTSWRVFDFMINFLTSWRLFDILTNFF